MLTYCPYCSQDSAGNHDYNCPMNPVKFIEQLKWPDREHEAHLSNDLIMKIAAMGTEIGKLQSRLSLALRGLREIQEHEHCDYQNVLMSDVFQHEAFNPKLTKKFALVHADAHRCCAAIAARTLAEIEGGK